MPQPVYIYTIHIYTYIGIYIYIYILYIYIYICILESSGRPPGGLDSTKRLVGNPTNHVRTGTETKFGLRRPRCAPHSTELEAVACSRQPARERTGAQTGCSSLSCSRKGARNGYSGLHTLARENQPSDFHTRTTYPDRGCPRRTNSPPKKCTVGQKDAPPPNWGPSFEFCKISDTDNGPTKPRPRLFRMVWPRN